MQWILIGFKLIIYMLNWTISNFIELYTSEENGRSPLQEVVTQQFAVLRTISAANMEH